MLYSKIIIGSKNWLTKTIVRISKTTKTAVKYVNQQKQEIKTWSTLQKRQKSTKNSKKVYKKLIATTEQQ